MNRLKYQRSTSHGYIVAANPSRWKLNFHRRVCIFCWRTFSFHRRKFTIYQGFCSNGYSPFNRGYLQLFIIHCNTGGQLNHRRVQQSFSQGPLNHQRVQVNYTGDQQNHWKVQQNYSWGPLNHRRVQQNTGDQQNHWRVQLNYSGDQQNHWRVQLNYSPGELNHRRVQLNYSGDQTVCFYPLQKADVLSLVSVYLVDRTGRVRQGKSTYRRNSSKQYKKLILAQFIHSFEEKSFLLN